LAVFGYTEGYVRAGVVNGGSRGGGLVPTACHLTSLAAGVRHADLYPYTLSAQGQVSQHSDEGCDPQNDE